jgi:Na+/H+ antiporter NhaD/arsenite permease-like protein
MQKKANHFLKKTKPKAKQQTTILKKQKQSKNKPDIHLYALFFFLLVFFFALCFVFFCFMFFNFRLFSRVFSVSGDLMTGTVEHVKKSWKKRKTTEQKRKQSGIKTKKRTKSEKKTRK